MNQKIAKLARWIGYPLFYVFALVSFTYLTFPYQRLKDRIVGEFNARQAAAGLRMKIEKLSPYWLSGVEAKGVELVSTPTTPGPDGTIPKPKTVTVSKAHARVSLLRLLAGTLHVNYGLDAFGGEISGYTSDADKGRTLAAELSSVRIEDVPMLADVAPVPIKGSLNGTIELKLPDNKLEKAEGKIALTLSDLQVGDGKSKVMNTIALPKLNAGDLVLEGEVTDGKFAISKLTATGKDLELVSDGQVRLRDPLTVSLAELNLRFKFNPAYRNKNDTTRALFGAPGSGVPAVFDLDPRIRQAKRPDEFYAFRLNGPLAHLNVDPAGGGGALLGAPQRAFPGGSSDEE